ncbi:cell division topological specificity factor MinE [Caldinitratiruptor microaerophilus]|uniref:Cell division topological specificity factor n=1 Tax=Caldinitratiruptor microaerophilus TaxID=671077 RepID=A0AA35GAP0_9FIRM|nr:cell division topological specificity factor MinE [Caldinitratiruptor microaerophilus]BDG61504.1 cell division topological specificity factor [Caldinitratiruptor microaerophilus]
MFDLIARVLGREAPSAEIAKERLRLVLVHDRASVTPQFLERLKEELIHVISEYMEIDTENMEVRLSQAEHQAVLVANIPVRRVRRAALVR